ncbi:MAG: hypothetical protein ABI651_17715 [Verrucomicrobiota bacterium]
MNIRQLAVAALTLSLCGCASTSVKQTWKSPTYTGGPVKKIAVLAVDQRDLYRKAVESHFVYQLDQDGQSAFVTYKVLNLAAIKADKQASATSLRENGADTLLLVRLVNQTTYATEARATPSYFTPTVSGYENNEWYGYYSIAFMDMGIVWGDSKSEVYLDSSLFDLKTGYRLWRGLTTTVLKEETDRIEELSTLVVKVLAAMRKDGLIH